MFTCTECGATANPNSREIDGWTIAPSNKMKCSKCNGTVNDTFLIVPATEPSMVAYIPVPTNYVPPKKGKKNK